jgi:TonB family protein
MSVTAKGPDNIAPDREGDSRKTLIYFALGAIAVMFLIEDVVGWINGGGIFSILAAEHAVEHRARTVDVDSSTLRTAFIALFCLVPLCLSRLVVIDLSKRWVGSITAFAVMGGAFILDGAYDESIVSRYMAKHGYTRCVAHDFHVGTGKSRVWFNDYVRSGADCPPYDADAPWAPIIVPNDPRAMLPRPARSVGSPATWFTSADYPADAMRNGESGLVRVRFVVGPDGRVRDCKPITPSGSKSLDTTTCNLLTTRARYWPARDAAGRAMSQTGTKRFRWLLPAG